MPTRPFDPIKASFYLIAFILGFQCLIVLLGVGTCMFRILMDPTIPFECDKNDKLSSLLSGALAAAIAFSGAHLRTKETENGKEEEKPNADDKTK